VDYLNGIGAPDLNGVPLHKKGISLTHPRLVYLRLEFQRSFSLNTLPGVNRDADFVMKTLAAQLRR
jgi:putative flavoprotein involved in K+ transport